MKRRMNVINVWVLMEFLFKVSPFVMVDIKSIFLFLNVWIEYSKILFTYHYITHFNKIIITYQKQNNLNTFYLRNYFMNKESFGKEYFLKRAKKGYNHLIEYVPSVILPRTNAIINELNLPKKSKVLDFGCAKGFYIKGFIEEGMYAFGYDISPEVIKEANDFLQKKITFSDFSEIKKLSNKSKFDLVMTKDTLEHIKEEKQENILKKLKDISYKVLIILPVSEKQGIMCEDIYKDPSHINMHSDKYWIKFLERFGTVKELHNLNKKIKKEYSTICCTFLVEFKNS
ncbi:MAG: class I SAM-dependent methyltransferase [Nanobdellota archaeon]